VSKNETDWLREMQRTEDENAKSEGRKPARIGYGMVNGKLRSFRLPDPPEGDIEQDMMDEGDR